MSDDIVNIEVDGAPVEARKGQMIIEVTDKVGTYVPRFCYHEKLTVAANCRILVRSNVTHATTWRCFTTMSMGMMHKRILTLSRYALLVIAKFTAWGHNAQSFLWKWL